MPTGLRALGLKGWRTKLRYAAMTLMACLGLTVATFFILDAVYPPKLDRFNTVSSEVVGADGSLLRLFPVENGRLRRAVTLDQVDPLFVDMLIAYEDKRFHDHTGVDLLAVLRAGWQALAAQEVVSGASTLTMQVARLLEPRPRTLPSKLIEMFRALQLERRHSKQQILEMYLTLAPYGGNVEGIRAASLAYFGHEADRLTPDEAALLVVLPQSPTGLRPDRYPARARAARNKVLARVVGGIGLDAHLAALAARAPVPPMKQQPELSAPHLAARLRADGGAPLKRTHIDAILQKQMEALALASARRLQENASLAILVVENKSRKVISYVGSADFTNTARDGFVDMVTAIRSPGSTLKPFIYGMAFDQGMAHPRTRIMDEPRRFGTYAPNNFMDTFYGEVTISEALRRSLNVPAVAVLDRLGPVHFTETLRHAGARLALPGEEKPGLAVALGGVGMSLEDLVMLYAALADDGQVRPLKLLDAPNQTAPATNTTLLGADARAALRHILTGIGAPGDRLPRKYQQNPRHIAFKTGTSYGFRDAWAVGYDGGYTVGVWIGRPDGTPMPGHFGSNTAAPVLFDAFGYLPQAPVTAPSSGFLTAQALPPGLKYFDRPQLSVLTGKRVAPLTLAFPLADSVVALTGGTTPITFAAQGGELPLQWFMDGKPLPSSRWSRNATLMLEGPGFYRVSVTDRNGHQVSARFSAQDTLR
ncbi:penicillin-binding protein 1C [Kordiimonas lacus]|uniref:peptidoglycan glycosyltransferase n=1 Tax=Kordiimonas lacus TaxID=637679 RepID=A0A1G7DR97_9PROT|nr:penicillin-binding protein 1C [Kordiimonas lacus]SDE54054.1 penicillin-binding protein 1C [Kordiimonas lacus]